MKKFKFLSAAAFAVLALSGTAQAALMFNTYDCDGVTGINEASNGDVCEYSNYTWYSVDVLYGEVLGNTYGQSSGGFTLKISDSTEIIDWNVDVVLTDLVLETSNSTQAHYSYDNVTLASDTVLATLNFLTGVVGYGNDNDNPDLELLSGVGQNGIFHIYTQATNELVNASWIDVQGVPIPASSVLMLGALATFAGLRRRAA